MRRANLSALLLLLAAARAPAQEHVFPGRLIPNVSMSGLAGASGDFDGDGIRDFLAETVFDADTADIQAFLGRGPAQYEAVGFHDFKPSSPVGHTAAVADFDLDGDLDVAVLPHAGSDLQLLRGHGDGDFDHLIQTLSLPELDTIAAVDLDVDGTADLAVVRTAGETLRTLRGKGDLSFSEKTSVTITQLPGDLVAADFNDNGKVDLMVANVSSNWMTLLRSKGDFTFNKSVITLGNSHASTLEAADFNGDGHMDVASGFIMAGAGDATFTKVYAGPDNGGGAVADFNDDGLPDCAVHAGNFAQTDIVLGRQAPLAPYRAHSISAIGVYHAGDFSGDGIADLVCLASSGTATLLGLGGAAFEAPLGLSLIGTPNSSMAVADLNDDGFEDVISFGIQGSPFLLVESGLPGGGFLGTASWSDFGMTRGDVGDLDLDGDLDLAVGKTGGVLVIEGLGDGTLAGGPFLATGTNPTSVLIADLDGLAQPEILHAQSSLPEVRVLVGQGAGAWSAGGSHATGLKPIELGVGDLDGDAQLDLVVACETSDAVSVHMGTGQAGFQPKVEYLVGDWPQDLLVTDLDGDLLPDVAVTGMASDFLTLLHAQPGGGFVVQQPLVGPTNLGGPRSVAAGDYDADGALDLVVGTSTGSLNLMRGDGAGHFDVADLFMAHTTSILETSDFDDDGVDDLLLSTPQSSKVLFSRPLQPAGQWRPGSPALLGTSQPLLQGFGLLQAGTPASLVVSQHVQDQPALLFVGSTHQPTPFKGGTLDTVPVLLALPIPSTGPTGYAVASPYVLPFTWPAGLPSAFTLVFQLATLDSLAPQGVSLSNAIVAVTP